MLEGLYYEDYDQSTVLRTMSRTVTVAEIVNFATLAGFFEEVFLSDEAAAASPFGRRIAPGALTFALAEGLIVQLGVLHNVGLAFLGVRDMKIPAPVAVGDTIRVEARMVEKRPSRTAGRGVVLTHNVVSNQKGQIVMEFVVSRLVRMRGQPVSRGVADATGR